MSRRTLWLDPGFGAAGDMVLGALIGLGAPIDPIRDALGKLDIDDWTLEWETTLRCSLSSSRALVTTTEGHHHRSWSTIDSVLASAGLPETVEHGSRRTFRLLGEVESGIHGVDIDEVHFHEVGAVDAIVDIVGSWLALYALDIDDVVCGPVGLGRGSTIAAHGRLPIPAPATTALLLGAEIRSVDVEAETVTPTGAALLRSMTSSFGPIPDGTLTGSARGAGGRDPEGYPNVISAYIVESSPSHVASGTAANPQPAVMLTTNLDDVTPELVGHTITACLDAGADDAWARAIVMKKNRPGVELNVLCAPDRVEALKSVVLAETATLGIREQVVTKHVLPRRFEPVEVRGHTVQMKVGPYGVKPEYEDLARAAKTLGLTVRQLQAEAMAAYLAADR